MDLKEEPTPAEGELELNKEIMNFIVFPDLFDSFIEQRHIYKEIARKTPNVKFLLFNLPGQAFTQVKFSQVLNNTYYVEILDSLLFYLNENAYLSLSSEPYSFITYGNGAAIALYYSGQVCETNNALRNILMFNGYSYIDHALKESLIMCKESESYYASLTRSTRA